MADVMLRYYQGLVDITEFCDFSRSADHPVKVYERVLFTPDEAVHYCSAEKMTDISFLDYVYEWDDDDEHDNDIFDDAEESNGPFPWHRIVKSYDKTGEVIFHDDSPILNPTYQGEFESLDEAKEYAQGNHLV